MRLQGALHVPRHKRNSLLTRTPLQPCVSAPRSSRSKARRQPASLRSEKRGSLANTQIRPVPPHPTTSAGSNSFARSAPPGTQKYKKTRAAVCCGSCERAMSTPNPYGEKRIEVTEDGNAKTVASVAESLFLALTLLLPEPRQGDCRAHARGQVR